MELQQHRRREVASYTIADAQTLHTIKNRLRGVTSILDASGKAYPHSLEAHQVKHEVVVLLTELQVHGLLPDTVNIAESSTPTCDGMPFQPQGLGGSTHAR